PFVAVDRANEGHVVKRLDVGGGANHARERGRTEKRLAQLTDRLTRPRGGKAIRAARQKGKIEDVLRGVSAYQSRWHLEAAYAQAALRGGDDRQEKRNEVRRRRYGQLEVGRRIGATHGAQALHRLLYVG